MKKALYISITLHLALILLVTFLTLKGYQFLKGLVIQGGAENGRIDDRIKFYSTIKFDSTNIVFIGNSLTEKFPVDVIFNKSGIINLGVGGATSKHIAELCSYVVPKLPAKIFLMVGINDILQKKNLEDLKVNIKEIITLAKAKKVNIYVQSILPVTGYYKKQNPEIRIINDWLKSYCDTEKLPFINLYPAFLNNSRLDNTLTYDGLHLKRKGYLLWKEQIEQWVH